MISLLSIFIISYYNQNELSCLWTSGLEDSIWELNKTVPKLQYLHITDGFKTWMNMHFYWSFLWSFPILLYQLGQFLKPGLKRKEWFNVILLGLFGTFIVSLFSGFLFTNYLWKHILEVLFNFGNNQVDFIPNMSNFLSFYRKTTIAFAIAACLPWIFFLFVKWGIFSYEQTVLLRRWWILIIFLIATIMSPPDVFSQIVIALPLWLFLEITWLVLALMESKKSFKKKE